MGRLTASSAAALDWLAEREDWIITEIRKPQGATSARGVLPMVVLA